MYILVFTLKMASNSRNPSLSILKNKINKVVLDYILLLCFIVGSKHNVDAMPTNYKLRNSPHFANPVRLSQQRAT